MEQDRHYGEEMKEISGLATYVSALELQAYLGSLQLHKRRQLKDFIDDHPFIESINKGKEKLYFSKHQALKEIAFIIKNHQERLIHESFLSMTDLAIQADHKLISQRISSIKVTQQNYQEIIGSIDFLKKIDSCPFQAIITEKQPFESKKPAEFFISSKCRGVRKVFFIFQHFSEMVKLQALVDIQWKLETINTIRLKFQEENIKMLKNNNNNYQLYFFQRISHESWEKFIDNINRETSYTYFILMKFSLFPQLYSNKHKFRSIVKLAFPETDLSFGDFTPTQLKIYEPEVEFSIVEELALKILKRNCCGYTHNKQPLDCITCFNIIFQQEKGEQEINVVVPQKENMRNYIYFTFYQKFMEVIREEGKVILIERNQKQQIKSNIYLNSLQTIKKEAAINQIPFFYFCQNPHQIIKIQLSSLIKIKEKESNRLLYYHHKLNENRFKVTFSNEWDSKELLRPFVPDFQMKFQDQAILSKLGKLKSDEISSKLRKGTVGCVVAKESFCKQFVKRCLDDPLY